MLHIAIIYLFFVLFCLTYNRLSRRLGRFEIEFEEMAPERDERRNYPSGGGCRPGGAKTAMLES
jgi:hypothetical protein